jgi:hypothetical protein
VWVACGASRAIVDRSMRDQGASSKRIETARVRSRTSSISLAGIEARKFRPRPALSPLRALTETARAAMFPHQLAPRDSRTQSAACLAAKLMLFQFQGVVK